ncbi:MAG TPA: ABC transporter permease [Candidatus Krumholzibacteria bacterium]|nr:ABC transporter permease [Candidatus Krumholzibacteria bacterium]
MGSFLARRALQAVLLVAITLTLTFVLLHVAPGDPLARYLDPSVDPADVERIRHSLGLDRPLHVRFIQWAKAFVVGDFGVSLAHHRPVRDLLAETIPRTLVLTSVALAVQLVLGILVGTLAAHHRRRAVDRVLSFSVVLLYAVPSYYLAYLLIEVFAVDHSWLPTSGISTPGLGATGAVLFWDHVRHLVLPAVVLGIASAAGFARFTRGSMVEVLAEDYVRTARAKGLPESSVVWRHAFRNALGVLITLAGLSAPLLLGGAVIVETVFAWPGMGSLMVESIYARDYPVVLAINFVGACMVIGGNFLADVATQRADPRATVEGGAP